MKNHKFISVTALLVASLTSVYAQFTAGNLAVLRDGTGSAALTSAGTAIFLDQYTTSGTFVNSLGIPTAGATALVNSGSAGSEGALNLSANGQYLVFAGYNAAAGTASIASSTAAAAPRGVATVDASGNYTLAATTSTAFSANNIRSGTTDGSGNFWAAGANGGTIYYNTATTATRIAGTAAITANRPTICTCSRAAARPRRRACTNHICKQPCYSGHWWQPLFLDGIRFLARYLSNQRHTDHHRKHSRKPHQQWRQCQPL